MKIYNDVTELIGNTPLVRLNRLNRDGYADVLLKLNTSTLPTASKTALAWR